MTTSSASLDKVARRGGAIDRARAPERTWTRSARRLLARWAETWVGRDGPSRWPHLLVWRLRSFVHGTPPAIKVFAGNAISSPATQLDRAILLVSHDLSASGAPQLLVEIGRILRDAGLAVLLLSPSDGPTREALVGAGITVIIDPAIRDVSAPIFARIAPAFDAAICNTVDAVAAVEAMALALPVIWYLHEVDVLEQRIATPSLSGALRRAARVWAGSEMTAAILRPLRPDVRIVPYGLERIGNGAPPGLGDRLELAVFGSYEMRKGQDLLVAAVELLSPAARDRVSVTLYGRILVPEYHATLAAQVAVLPGIELAGELDRAAYIAAMLASDAVVVPSRADSLPLVSLDALGAGRVLMCTATTGTAQYLTVGSDGFVAAKADAESIATMLEQAVAVAAEWPTIAERGRRLFGRSFSRSAFAAVIETEIAALVTQEAVSDATVR